MTETPDRFALRQHLAACGLSITAAARTLGVSRRALHYWLSGARPVPPEHAQALAAMRPARLSAWTAADLRRHLRAAGVTVADAYVLLACSRRDLASWLRGAEPVPRWVEAAVRTWR